MMNDADARLLDAVRRGVLRDARTGMTITHRATMEPIRGPEVALDNWGMCNLGSFNGLKYTTELQAKGWKVYRDEDTGDVDRCGDPHLIDPITGKMYLPYEAILVQLQREKDDADRALEMRDKR